MKIKIIKLLMLLFWLLVIGGISGNLHTANARTKGTGARIIRYDEPGTPRFHMGAVVGVSEYLDVEATGTADITDVQFVSHDTAICSVTREPDYWKVDRLKEGVAVITMSCKANDKEVERDLLISSYTEVGTEEEPVRGILLKGATVYYGCSDQEGISSASTEIKENVTADRQALVMFRCGEYYRVELENDETFGDSEEEWGYVKRSQVKIPVTGVSMLAEAAFFEGRTVDPGVKIQPELATDQTLTFQSSNTNVATVNAAGIVTGIHAGSAVITAKSQSDPTKLAKCRVTVKPYIPVTGIKIQPNPLVLDDGVSGKFQVQIQPENASIQDYSWKIEREDILRVTSKGRYTAMKPGFTRVTVKTKEGGFTDTCEVTVKPVPAQGVSLQNEMNIGVGEIREPVWRMVPVNATNKKVTWTSDDPAIASVDRFGNVMGRKMGSTCIRIQTEEGGFTASCKVTVDIYVADIELKRHSMELTLGKSRKLKVGVTPDNCTKKNLIWNSRNPSVVTVNHEGNITARKTGTAEITVYDRYTGAYDFCLVTVKANLATPKLKVKKKGKKRILSWKKIKRATCYYVYRYSSKSKSYQKIRTVSAKHTRYKIVKSKKRKKYKIRACYKPNGEFSKYSKVITV